MSRWLRSSVAPPFVMFEFEMGTMLRGGSDKSSILEMLQLFVDNDYVIADSAIKPYERCSYAEQSLIDEGIITSERPVSCNRNTWSVERNKLVDERWKDIDAKRPAACAEWMDWLL